MRIILFLSLIALIRCSPGSGAESKATDSTLSVSEIPIDPNDLFKLENYLTAETPDTSMTQMADFDCAVIIYPNDDQIKSMEEEYGDDFMTIADDAAFYQSEASSLLDTLQIRTVLTSRKYVQLKGEQQTWSLDVKKKGLPEWNMILFNTKRNPIIMPTAGIVRDSVARYFQKQ